MIGEIDKKVLVTDDVHPHLIEGLESLGYIIDNQATIPYESIFSIIHEYHGIIINSKVKMTHSLMQLGSNLEFIGRLGSGLEIIDQVAAKEMSIAVFSAPEGNKNAVAEHAMGMLLVLANQLLWADQDVRRFEWDREARRGWELEGKTVGIIGFGNNGSSFAKKLMGFDVQVLAYDKYKKNYAIDYEHVCETDLDNLIMNSDVISLHVPLDTSTHFLINENFISKCKGGVIIINSSRGKVIDTKALIKGLDSGQIGGACLDVFENEKTASFSEDELVMYGKLYEFKQVVLSPHVAGWTVESKYKIANSLLKQISILATKQG